MTAHSSRLISSLDNKTYRPSVTESGPGPSLLARGIGALRAGDTSLARRLLALAARHEPDSEQAWVWLSAVLQTPQGRSFCLRQALACNPENRSARRGLEALDNLPPAPVLIAHPATEHFSGGTRTREWLARKLRLRPSASHFGPSSTLARIAKYTSARALGIGLTVVVGLFLAIVLINFGGFVDQIYRTQINWTLAQTALGMRGVPAEEKAEILEQARWEMEEAVGLHEPFLRRCLVWLRYGLTLSWENAPYVSNYYGSSETVMDAILTRLPNTLLLAGTSNLLLFILALLVAMFLSRKHGTLWDKSLIALSPISSAPNWVYGILLTLVFAAQLRLLPFGGKFDAMPPKTQFNYVFVVLRHMILPVAAILLSMFFQTVYAWRTFFLLHGSEDYVEMAKARGLPARTIERRYILQPTLPYVLTSFALLLIGFWQTTMALEIFFDWPGIGALFVEAVWGLARALVISLIVIFAYLLAVTVFVLDILYALVDPRVKVGAGGQATRSASPRTRPRMRLWPRRRTRPVQARAHSGQAAVSPAGPDAARPSLRERVRRSKDGMMPIVREIRRYPAAIAGLIAIGLLAVISTITVVAIPPERAVSLWRENDPARYRIPAYAKPEWVNLFRKNDLPRTIVQSTTDGTANKHVGTVSEEMTERVISFAFDYPYQEFPQDLAIYLKAQYVEKRPFVSMVLLTPDKREIEIDSFSMSSAHTYRASADTSLRYRDALGGEGGDPMRKLFAAPGGTEAAAVPGSYELRLYAVTFEQYADVDAELVVYGQVHGLAGTDHQRRDLTVALLWGIPVALAFGLLGAVCTSLATMAIAGVGVWFGGRVDAFVQRVSEVNMILPALPIAITVYLVYAKSIWAILGVMVLLSVFGSALKNYRAMFLQIVEAPYIEAARGYGASDGRIIRCYLIPRILPVLIPQLVTLVPGYVFLEATLAFLGVSDVYLPTWGKVINDALTHNVFQGHYYWVLEPVALLLLTGLAFAMLGFSLDSIFNPRLRER